MTDTDTTHRQDLTVALRFRISRDHHWDRGEVLSRVHKLRQQLEDHFIEDNTSDYVEVTITDSEISNHHTPRAPF